MTFRAFVLQLLFFSAIAVCFLNAGCASFDRLFGANDAPEIIVEGEPVVRFSDNNNYLNESNRNYRRMTRELLEEESQLHSQAGSMWVMEGQGAYLFAQNKMRREGDLLNVQVEGPAQKQVETKVDVIKTLLKQLEEEEKRAGSLLSPLASRDPVSGQKLAEGKDDGRGPASTPGSATGSDDKKETENSSTADAVKTVPTRIIEKLADGNYRVKGQQPFMIGQREYKVIVTGIIRPEDFNDGGVSSNKLLDPQFDVVSIRKKETVR